MQIIENEMRKKIEEESLSRNLIPKKRDFYNQYKFIQKDKKQREKNTLDNQYFNIKRAKAVATKKQKTFIVKQCKQHNLNNIVRQFTMNEVNFVQQVSHASVYAPIEIYEEKDKVFLIYEEMQGGTMLDLINKCIEEELNLSNEEIATIVYKLAAFLHFTHEKGYVHRDLKPENIAFEKENDFRSLKITSFLTCVKKQTGTDAMEGINGSYLYMAPEMIMGQKYNEKVDIWSLGVIFYMLITQQHPINYIDNDISR